MLQYTFTDEQLYALLTETVGMFREYMHAHGYKPEHAVTAAANELIEGLIAKRELADHGEIDGELSQVYQPQSEKHQAEIKTVHLECSLVRIMVGDREYVIRPHGDNEILIVAPEAVDALPKIPHKHDQLIVRYHRA